MQQAFQQQWREGDLRGHREWIAALLEQYYDPMYEYQLEQRAGRELSLFVRDDGCGVEEPELERMTDLFFTTKETGRGTGLGLPLVLSVASQHGGRVHLTRRLPRAVTVGQPMRIGYFVSVLIAQLVFGILALAITAHPDFDKIAFTGSTSVGRIIRRVTAGTGKNSHWN